MAEDRNEDHDLLMEAAAVILPLVNQPAGATDTGQDQTDPKADDPDPADKTPTF